MKRTLSLAVALCAGLVATSTARAAGEFLETFGGGANGWTAATGQLSTTGSGGVLNYAPAVGSFSSEFITADATASGGAFVGDYRALGNLVVSFDLFLAPGSSVDTLSIDLFNPGTGDEWQFALTAPTAGVVNSYSVSFNAIPLSAAGWSQVSGSNGFDFILSNTRELSLAFTGSGTGPSGYIDNFQFVAVPEPGTVAAGVLSLGFAGSVWLRRRKVA